jgi:hypothetical protein
MSKAPLAILDLMSTSALTRSPSRLACERLAAKRLFCRHLKAHRLAGDLGKKGSSFRAGHSNGPGRVVNRTGVTLAN